MNQATINLKIDQKIKTEAQKLASEMGLSLSGVINLCLRRFINDKEVSVNLKEEKPSARLIKVIKKAEEDIKSGNVYKADNIDDFIDQLKISVGK